MTDARTWSSQAVEVTEDTKEAKEVLLWR